MNVQNPRKRIISPKDRHGNHMLDFLKTSPPKVDINIKHNVGEIDRQQLKFGYLNNRTNSPTGEMIPKHQRFSDDLDDDSLNMLTDVLLDISDSETDNIIPQISEQEVLKHDKSIAPIKQLYRRKKTEMIPDYEIDFHMLTPIFKEWTNSVEVDKETLIKYTYRLGSLIKFLVDNNIQHPTMDHIMTFIEYNVATLPTGDGDKKNYISSIIAFFKWTNANHKYKNITEGLKSSKALDPIAGKFFQNQDSKIKNVHVLTEEGSLSKILNLWAHTLISDDATKTRYKSVIYSLVAFFCENNLTNPTPENITEYYQKYIFIRDNIEVDGSFEIIKNFFSWANTLGIYPNIAANARPEYIPIPQEDIENLRKELIEETQNNTKLKMTLTIREMVKSGFSENEAESLINIELIVIKNWIQNLNVSSLNTNYKHYILDFAYFLYSNKITTPTQKNITDFYDYLIENNFSGIIGHISAIKLFFKWTASCGIYPNIAINVVSLSTIQIDPYPIILRPKKHRRHIPNPQVPLIAIRQ